MYVESMLCWCQGRGILWLVCRRLLLVAVCNLASSQCNVIISLWLCGVVGMDIQYLTVGIASAISIPGKWFPKFNYSPYLVILVVAINNESHEEVAIWIQYNANSTCAIFEIFSSFSCCVIQMQIHLYKWMSISLKLASDNHTVSQEMWHATFLCFLCISDCILNFSYRSIDITSCCRFSRFFEPLTNLCLLIHEQILRATCYIYLTQHKT